MENNNIVNDIERIVKENKVQVIESNGRTFATKSLVEIEPRKDVAAEIRFSDLSSIVEIVKREMQRFVLPIYINIESEACVSVITSLDGEKDREKPYSAVAEGNRFRFGNGYDYDVFNSDIKNRGYAKQHLVLDFLKQEDKLFSFEHDILTNPPYKYATEFVLKALELLHEGCKCYMFLKLTFLEGKRRYIELFRDTPPAAFTSFPSAFYAPKTQSLTVCGRAAAPPSRMRGLCGKRATRGQQRCGGYRRTA